MGAGSQDDPGGRPAGRAILRGLWKVPKSQFTVRARGTEYAVE